MKPREMMGDGLIFVTCKIGNAGHIKLNRQSRGHVTSLFRKAAHRDVALMLNDSPGCFGVRYLSSGLGRNMHTSIYEIEDQLPLETCVMLIC